MNKTLALKKELDVFRALCPLKLMKIYNDENATLENTIKMINTLNALGFSALANELITRKNLHNENEIISEEKTKSAALFIQQFINGIKSDGLKEIFSRAVQKFIQPEFFDEFKKSVQGKRQELEVFKALCPKEYMNILKKKNKGMDEYMKLILALEKLGFSNMADDIYISEYATKFESDMVNRAVYFELPAYIELFLDNIKSDSLKKVFAPQKAKKGFSKMNSSSLNPLTNLPS